MLLPEYINEIKIIPYYVIKTLWDHHTDKRLSVNNHIHAKKFFEVVDYLLEETRFGSDLF